MVDKAQYGCKRVNASYDSGSNSLGDTTTYTVGKKTFIIEPHFKDSGNVTIADILVRLMKADSAKA